MTFELSVPSKTFLAGEYIATQGEAALVLNTEPRFNLLVSPSLQPEGVVEGISPESPAGHFLMEHSEIFKGRHLKFQDPHRGSGGFGASSAQFALCYVLYQQVQQPEFELFLNKDFVSELLQEYLNYAWTGKGLPPSGADVVSQLFMDQIGYWRRKEFEAASLNWGFAEHGFLLVKTGIKKATHLHLNSVEDFEEPILIEASLQIKEALKQRDFSVFASGVDLYQQELQRQQLTCPESLALLGKIKEMSTVACAKGCGALGADVLFIGFDLKNQSSIERNMAALGLEVATNHQELTGGFLSREVESGAESFRGH